MEQKSSLKLSFIFILMIFHLVAVAQNFKWKSPIAGIKSDGFQKIQLSPQIGSKLNGDFGDIRIIDASGKEIPYILENEQPFIEKDNFNEYKIIEKKEQNSWPYYTRIVLHNPKKSEISNINLIIRNSDVTKKLKLSGSDENQKWYVIKDNYLFRAMYSDNETSVIKIIDFPLSNYEYYEILIDDWKDNPINVLKAGYLNTSVEKGKYTENDKPEIRQTENKALKESTIKLKFKETQLIHKLSLKIDGSDFYYRNVSIQIPDSMIGKRNKYEPYFRSIDNTIISSNSSNTFYFDNIRTKELYIKVSNHDDQPLKISGAVAYQLNHYLICKLKSSETYNLVFGNQEVHAPEYDIKYFSKEIPGNIPLLTSGAVELSDKNNAGTSSGFHLDKRIIWVVIGLVVILLIYMVSKMMGEMQKNKNV